MTLRRTGGARARCRAVVRHLIDPETVTPQLRAAALATVLDPATGR